jgi:hypothetical protein
MHWASYGETAAETVYKRVNSSKEHMGLTNFKGEIPSKKEVETANMFSMSRSTYPAILK